MLLKFLKNFQMKLVTRKIKQQFMQKYDLHADKYIT